MLFEKPRYPDQSLYTHPGSRGMPNPSILVPNFIERRYDDMVAVRSRDGDSESETTKVNNVSFNNNRHEMKYSPSNPNLQPIFELDNEVRSETNGRVLKETKNDDKNDNTDNITMEGLVFATQNNYQAEEHSIKHPLKQSWTFWYFDMNGGAASWD